VVIFRPAFQALQQNWAPVLVYMAVSFLLSASRLGVDTYVFPDVTRQDADTLTRTYMLGIDVAVMAIIALAQTIAFSRIGREIDRPMWRVSNDRLAISLFYKLWLLLAMMQLTTEQILVIVVQGTQDAAAQLMLYLMWMLFISLLTPLGACIMFYGRVGRHEAGQAFSTMVRHLPTTLMIAMIGVLFGMILIDLQPSLPEAALPALALAGGYVDCFLFAAMWLVCIHHRDDFEDEEDDDFNF